MPCWQTLMVSMQPMLSLDVKGCRENLRALRRGLMTESARMDKNGPYTDSSKDGKIALMKSHCNQGLCYLCHGTGPVKAN